MGDGSAWSNRAQNFKVNLDSLNSKIYFYYKKKAATNLRNYNLNQISKFLQSMHLLFHKLLAACLTINPHIKHHTENSPNQFVLSILSKELISKQICSSINESTELETTASVKIKQL